MGWGWAEVADELGMSAGGAHELHKAFCELMPKDDAAGYRAVQLATLEHATKVMSRDLASKDTRTRRGAAMALQRLVHEAALVSGVVKLAPTVVVIPPRDSDQPVLAHASLDDLRELEAIRKRMAAPALEAHVVEAEGEKHGQDVEREERSGDPGDRSAVDDRA